MVVCGRRLEAVDLGATVAGAEFIGTGVEKAESERAGTEGRARQEAVGSWELEEGHRESHTPLAGPGAQGKCGQWVWQCGSQSLSLTSLPSTR